MGDNIPLTDPEGDSSLSFYDAAMDLENCNMSGTLLNTHGNQWCISCRNLKQTIEKMRDEYETNYKMLKEKIISTNDLIKRYKLKCDEFDVISKKLCETEKKLDISTRASDGLMVRLRQAVEEQMPVKETNAKLGKKVKFQERLIAELQDQVGAVTTLQTQLNALKKESEREKGKLLAECTEVKQQHKQVLVSQKKGEEKLTKTLENMKTLKQQLSAAQRENKKLSKENEKLQLKLTRQQSAANKQGHLDVGKFATSDSKLARGHSRSPAERNLGTEEDSLDLIFRDIGILSRLGWKDEERSIVSPLPSSPASSLNTTDEDSSDEELGNEVARLLEGKAEMADTSPMSMLPIDMSDDSSDSDVIDEVPFQCAESSVQQLVAVFEASPVKLGIRKVARPTAVDGGLRKRVGTVRDVGRCSVDTFGDEGISCDEMQCGSQVKITNVKCRDLNEEIEHDTIEQICSANMVECTHFTDMVECINSVDTVEQTHLADTVEQTHSADTVEETQSADTVEQTHLANKVEQTHLADTVEQTHSADTVEQTPSADTVGQTHSVDTVEQTNSINAVEQTYSVDTVEQTHSAGTMEQTHLADTVEQAHSADTVEQTHLADTLEQTHSADTLEQTHSADTVEQTHSVDTLEQTHSADTMAQTHLADTLEQAHLADTVEQTHSTDTVEQTHSADMVEQTHLDDSVEQTHSTDTVEQTHSADMVEQTHVADSVEQTHSADTLKQTHLADTVEQTHVADSVEQTHSADTLKQTHSADTVEQTHSADTLEQTHLADTLEQTHSADTVEQAHSADTMEQTHSIDTVEQTHSIDTVEKTHSIDTVEQTHSQFTSPVCGSMTVENKTKTVTNTSSVTPPETPVQVLLEVTPPEMQVLPEVTTPKMSVLPEVTLPKMPVLPEVTPPEMQVLPEVTLPNMPVLPEVTLPKMLVLPEVTLPKMPVLPEVTTPKMSVLPQVTLPKVHVLQVTKTLPQIQTSKPSRTKVTAPSVQLEKTSTNNSVKTLNQQREVNIIGKKAETVLLANKDVDLTKLTDKDLQRVPQNPKTTVKDTSVVGKKAETVLLANKDVEKAKMAEKSLQRVPRNTPATVKDTSVASMSGLLNPTAVSDKNCQLPAPLQADTVGSVTLDDEADLLDSLFGLPQPVSPLPVSPAHQQETGSRRFFPDVDEHQVKPMKETLSQTPDGCWPVQEKVSSSVGKPQGKAGKRKKAQGGTGGPNKKRTSVNQYPVSSLMSSAGLGLLAPGHTVIDEELQLLLRGSVLPAQTATNISRGQPVIHPDVLVNCVANILYASKADVLPAIHSYCTAEPQQLTQQQQLWQPFMTADEHQILELLLHLDGQRQFVNIFEMLRVKILTILHSTENVLIPGRTALCRLFTAVCRMKGDISRVRVLAYDTVHSSFHAFPRMILAIACVWPEALKAGGGEVTCVMRCLQYVIHKNLQESKVRHSQMWQCLAKLCGWQKHSDVQEDATVLATVAIEKLLHSSDEAHLYDAEKALELLSMKEGWQWTNNQLIIKLIWPVLQQWATGGQHPFSDRAIGSLLRVLGVVTNNCPVQYASAAYDIAQTLQALLNHSVNSAVPVCDTIQEAVLEALMLLAPFKPDLSAHACYTWVKQRHKQKCLGDHVKSKIRDFVEHYKLQFKYLTQLTNML